MLGAVVDQPLLPDENERRAQALLSGWEVTSPKASPARKDPTPAPASYAPLLDTFRLYAGWLLTWYAVVFALGSYQITKNLPWEIPLVSGITHSPLVLTFAFGTFFFLLLSSVWKRAGKHIGLGVLLTLLWVLLVYAFRINI